MTAAQAWGEIAEFCPTIRDLALDDSVSEIECNPDGSVFVERRGITEQLNARMPESERENGATCMARDLGKDISRTTPLFDGYLPTGLRVSAVCPPVSSGWCFSIRRFRDNPFTFEELVENGTMTAAQCNALLNLMETRQTILVSGGTSTGKTSICNTLCSALPASDRIVVIEDTSELRLSASPNLVRFEAQPQLGVNTSDLVKQALRFAPARIIVGEVRGAEAFDLLMALNSGHEGSLSTIHSSSAAHALGKLVMYAAMAQMSIPVEILRETAGQAIHAVVQLRRVGDRRKVHEILKVKGYNMQTHQFDYVEQC